MACFRDVCGKDVEQRVEHAFDGARMKIQPRPPQPVVQRVDSDDAVADVLQFKAVALLLALSSAGNGTEGNTFVQTVV